MSFSRPRVSALAAAGLAGVLVLALSACTPEPEPEPTPTATASAAPIFASDEEALAAAVKAYEAYSKASAEVAARGGEGADSIDPFVSARFRDSVHDEMAALAESGGRLKGQLSIDTTSLVSLEEDGDAVSVSIYLCRDVSDVRAISSDGTDVTPAERQVRIPTQAFFVSVPNEPAHLVIDGIDKWSGDDFC